MHMETALDLLQQGEKPCYEAFLMPEEQEEEETNRGASVRESIMLKESQRQAALHERQTFKEKEKEKLQQEPEIVVLKSKYDLVNTLYSENLFSSKVDMETETTSKSFTEVRGLDKKEMRQSQDAASPKKTQSFVTPKIVRPTPLTTTKTLSIDAPGSPTVQMITSGDSSPSIDSLAMQRSQSPVRLSPKGNLGGKLKLPVAKPITMSSASTNSSALDSKNQSLTFQMSDNESPKNKSLLQEIREEDSMLIEEGCDNELDRSRMELQQIRIDGNCQNSYDGSDESNDRIQLDLKELAAE